VFLAGATGALLRHLITVGFYSRGIDKLFITLGVNLVAGLIAGFLITINANGLVSKLLKKYETVVIGGFLGGFSTVAAVSWMNYELLSNAQLLLAVVFLFCNYFGAFFFGKLGQLLADVLVKHKVTTPELRADDNN
jgi:fluoride ion exporter CrcB/FEX